MPFYHELKIRDHDSDGRKAEKRRIATRLLALREALGAHIDDPDQGGPGGDREREQVRQDSKLILRLATWNIREFDSAKFDYRIEEAFYYIAEILSNFDLIAVQEVRENLDALRRVMKLLGPSWDYMATDVTMGSGGNGERMAFVFNRDKVWFRNVAGELVLSSTDRVVYPHEERLSFDDALELALPAGQTLVSPADVATRRRSGKRYLTREVTIDLPEGARMMLPVGSQLVLPRGYEVALTDDDRVVLPAGSNVSLAKTGRDKEVMVRLPKGVIVGDALQFARTPSIVAFQSGWLKINLCTVHIYYGSGKAGLKRRRDEIRQLTKALAQRAARDQDTDNEGFMVVLGDFNIIDRSHETMKALNSNGFAVPEALQRLPGSNVDRSKAYDQIAYWTDPDGSGRAADDVTRFEVYRAGVFDFFKTVFREGDDDADGADEALYTGRPDYKPNWSYREWRTHQMSDHLPMWIEVRVDFGDDYLVQVRDSG